MAAMAREKIEDLKSNIAFARRKALPFGLCLGKSPETTLLLCHKTKEPATLGRQAKKEGETAKFTYGTMVCKSKDLLLTCEGDMPTGLPRKMKEMMKAAGIQLKVRVLDTGGASFEDEDEEQEEPAPKTRAPAEEAPESNQAEDTVVEEEEPDIADPKAQEWETFRQETAARVATFNEEGEGDTDAINALWTDALGNGEGGNFEDALKAAHEVGSLIEAGTKSRLIITADREKWLEVSERIRPHIEEALESGQKIAKKIQAVWTLALGKVEAPNPDYAAAIKSTTMLVKLLGSMDSAKAPAMAAAEGDTAPAAADPQPSAGGGTGTVAPEVASGDTPAAAADVGAAGTAPDVALGDGAPGIVAPEPASADLSGDGAVKLARTDSELTAIRTLIATYMGLITGSSEPNPVAWQTEITRTEGLISPFKAPGAVLDEAVIDQILRDLTKLTNDVNTKTVEKKAWKRALDLFNIRLSTLDHHAQSGSAEMRPLVDQIKADLAAAIATADTQDFQGAISALAPLSVKCDEVELLCDDCARYNALLQARTDLVATTRGMPTGVAAIDAIQTQAETLLADAIADAALNKFDDAVDKLDQIPEVQMRFQVQADSRTEYLLDVARIDAALVISDAMPAAQRALMDPGYTTYKQDYANAKVAVTNDFLESRQLLLLLRMKEHRYYKTTAAAIIAYSPALTAFEANYNLLKTHAGRPGVEEYFQEMEADYAAAKNEAAVNKFSTATGLLQRTAADFPAEKQRADDYVTYVAKRDAMPAIIDPLRSNPAAANGVAQADALIASAATQSLARDYAGALVNVVEAEARAAEAKIAADAQDALGALNDTAALDDIAANFAGALQVFNDMRANVAGHDTTGTFAAEITAADTPAAAAQAASTATPPNFVEARTQLDAAIAILEALLPNIMAFGPYQTHLTAAKTMVDTTLPAAATNLDNCIQPLITEAQGLVADAEALAAAPGLDIAGAEAKLVECKVITDKAQADSALYISDVSPAIVSINAQKALIALPVNAGISALMIPRVTLLDQLLADIQSDIAAKNMASAAAHASRGMQLIASTQDDIATATEALRRKVEWYDVKREAVKDQAICAPLVASAETKLLVYTTDIADGNFRAAQEGIKPPVWDLMAGERLVIEQSTFEPIRANTETELNKVKAVRNSVIEADLAALEARYSAALSLGTADNFHRATIEMTEIFEACQPLVDRATQFAPYEAARLIARPKLDEALAHAEATAIQPMLVRLTTKYDAAVAKAAADDFTAALTMMTEIGPDAELAIQSADDSATFGIVTGAAEMLAESGVLPPAALMAAQEIFDRLAARPEAPAAKVDLDEARTQLATAGSSSGTTAKTAVLAAISACERAEEVMSQHRMLQQSVDRATATIAALKAHAQAAYIATNLTPVETSVNGAIAAVIASGNHAAATTQLETDIARLSEITALADKYADYLTRRASPDGDPKLELLERHDHRYAIKTSIDTMRAKLATAEIRAEGQEIDDALTLLNEVKALGLSAEIMADMAGNTVPTPAQFDAIMDGPGGTAELDAMVANLDLSTQSDVIAAAFEARFDTKLNLAAGAPGAQVEPNIQKYYALMATLPPGHAADNDSLLTFTDDQTAGSAFGGREITMAEGEDELSGAYGFGRDFEVGGQDPECEPVDMEPVTRFSWNTLHEVGHAVDDQHSFMDGKAGERAFGGWEEYGRNIGTLADIFATKFGYDRDYIEQLMAHSAAPAIPEVPAGATCSAEEWERRRIDVTAHISRCYSSAKPWNSNAQAEQIAIDGRCYQESYPGDWKSYVLDARKQGMTGYQFRAPGEWFSELYAAFHIGKMKPAHPANGWLTGLNGP